MKVVCEQNRLQKAVGVLEKLTGRNLTLPILSTIHISTGESSLLLRATNLEVGGEIEIPATVEKQGVLTIPGSTLSQFLTNIPEEKKITLAGEDGNLHISSDKVSTIIKGFDKEEFPILPVVEGDTFEIDADKLVLGIRSVLFSAATSDIKPELSSVYIYSDDRDLVFVSTDSFRLAEKKIKMKNPFTLDGVIIPFRNAVELTRVFEDSKDVVTVTFSKNQISFISGNIYFTSRIIDGVFPDYKQILPKDPSTEVLVLKQDLIQNLKITNIFSNKLYELILCVDPQKKKFTIETKNIDVGESILSIPATLKGDSITLHYNQKYLSEVFPSITQDSTELLFHGPNKPVIMKGAGDQTFIYLVMPMNR